MADRTFKFYGQAFSPTGEAAINATFNGVKIYSGSVPTTNAQTPQWATDINLVMFQYTGTTDLTGNIPFVLEVTRGTVFFGLVKANYSGIKFDQDLESVIITPENCWSDVNQNSADTDGKNNVKINNVDQIRNVIGPEQIGDWWYRIFEGDTLTCDIFVDPDLIVTE